MAKKEKKLENFENELKEGYLSANPGGLHPIVESKSKIKCVACCLI